MKPKSTLLPFLALAGSSLFAISSASAQTTYTWASSNVEGASPASSLNWINATQATWTNGTPVSSNQNTIQFLNNNTTALNLAAAVTQASVLDNGGTAFELATLILSGKASGTNTRNLTMNLSGDALNFSAATGTVNLDALNNGSRTIAYNVANHIQLGTAILASNLTLAGDGTSAFNFSGNFTELKTGGGSKLIKSGSSTATISGAVTVSGGLEVNAGILALSGSSNAITGGITLNGGTLDYSNASTINGNNISVNGAATLRSGSNTSINSSISLNSDANLSLSGNNTTQTLTSAVTGTGSLTVTRYSSGSGAVNLSSTANTFTGGITFANQNNSLTLTVNSLADSATLGAGNISFTGINTGYSFVLGNAAIAPLTLANRQIEFAAGSTTGGALVNSSSQAFTINTDLLVGATGSPTLTLRGNGAGLSSFNGLIANGSGTVGLTKSEGGTWVLGNSANSYTGPTSIQAGTLSIGKLADFSANSSIGAASSGSIILGNGNNTGTLLYTGGEQSTNRTIQINTSANTNTGGGAITNNGTGTLTFTAATFNQAYTNGSTVTRNLALGGSNNGVIEGVIQNNSATNSVSLTKTGTGAWKLSGANTYSGVTTVSANGGTLQFGKASSLYNGNTASWTAANIRVANGGTLAFNVGGTDEFTSTDVGTLFTNLANSTNATTNGMAAGSGFGFDTTNASGGSFEISQVIANSGGTAGGARGLTKLGTGTLVLSNTNTYTGATTVTTGTLIVNGNISTSVLTTVNAGTTLGGSGTVGATTINGVLAPGNSIGTLNATGDVTWNDNDAWVFELGSAASTLALADSTLGLSDLLNITGGNDFLKGTGSSFTFDFAGGGMAGWYKLVDWTGTTDFVASNFLATNLDTGLTATFTVDSDTSALYLNVIPEPRAALLGGLGLLALLRRRRG